MAKGYWIVHIPVTDPEIYPKYQVHAVPELLIVEETG